MGWQKTWTHLTKDEIKVWCEENLFGNRNVPGVGGMKIPLSPTQKAVQLLAVEIIEKWEARNEQPK
jgi:hypothetical protein